MSDPYERDIFTISLNPRLASHAPKVNRIILIYGIGILFINSIAGIKITILNIMPSSLRRDISKWFR